MMPLFFRKFAALVKIYWQENIVYRAAMVIWILADAQLGLIMPAVWISAYGGSAQIFGMSQPVLVTYYLLTLLMSQFIVCHLLWDIAFEIREGMFVNYLVRPFSILWLNVARNTAWRTLKLVFFIPFLILFFICYGSKLGGVPLHFTAAFFITLLLAHTLSFFMAHALAYVSFFTTEFISIFQIYYFPEILLSGRLVPLDALPGWVKAVANALPFRYTVALPVQVLLGRLDDAAIVRCIALQVFWIFAFAIAGRAIFRVGIRQYTGFGN